MAYSAEDIFSQYRKTFVIAPFKPRQVTPLGYDLILGFAVVFDVNGKIKSNGGGLSSSYTIPPGGFALLVSLERVCLSGKVLGTVHARARLSMRGLMMNAVTVDPNFGNPHREGKSADEFGSSRLLLRVNNVSNHSITLTSRDDSIATLVLHEVNTETKRKPKMKDFAGLILELRKSLKEIVDDAVWELLDKYLAESTKTNNGKPDKVEDELRTAIEEMLHFRSESRNVR